MTLPIRHRLALVCAGLVAVLIVGFGTLVYLRLEADLTAATDDELRTRAEALVEDGDPDIAVSTVGGRLVLLQNRIGGRNWLEVGMDGFHPGAVVTAVLPDGRELVREIQAGSSYLSSEDPRATFGLGGATKVASLSIRWPGGKVTTLTEVAANQVLRVEPPR